eukprot:CAMPEP_0181316308 /NCGR_PEP_ID=MMETSP1101-20121128/15825_1 /TAXON_ID=46948 /ORGANISM="Rhodomonas abbreviata, Strain Caron Lab Isolate" /LENGTH=76 /DNA_ID=CAMNT_0023423545 /DNA_START=139 /DNA_END=369 /DNA_ORIENTATION=+
MFECLRLGKDSWLETGNDSTHAWWDHKGNTPAMPGTPGALVIKKAPGWSSLLPQTARGVDAGLQCPMCSTSSQPKY